MRSGVRILLGAMLALVPGLPPGPAWGLDGYAEIKRALYDQVFAERRETLYCACPFDADRRPDLAACGYASRRNGQRSRRIEIEHVVPASWIGEGRRCWREEICRDGRGRAFKGRKCCLAVDPAFRSAYQDMHNLWPTVGEVNESRRNYRFGEIPGEARLFGRCDFEVDPTTRRAEPRPAIRGDVARISLYMAETHGVRLNAAQRRLFEAWSRDDPPDEAERRRHDAIERLQGRRNPWLAQGAAM
jgi:deoxyribonuclease-1